MKISITRGNDVIVSSSDEEITMQEVKAIKRKERYTNHESTLRVSLVRPELEIIVKKNIINPDEKDFEVMTIFGIPVLFTNERITKDNIPNDISISIYDLRNDDEYFCELKDEIIVNRGGTILVIRPAFDTRSQNGHIVTSKAGYHITRDDYNFIGISDYSINDYINNYDHLVDEYGYYLPKSDNSTEEEQVDQESVEINTDETEEINKSDDSAEEERMEFDVKSKFTAPEPENYEKDEDILSDLPRPDSNKVINDFFAKEAKEERMYGTKRGGSRDKYVKGGAKRGKKNSGRRNVDNY